MSIDICYGGHPSAWPLRPLHSSNKEDASKKCSICQSSYCIANSSRVGELLKKMECCWCWRPNWKRSAWATRSLTYRSSIALRLCVIYITWQSWESRSTLKTGSQDFMFIRFKCIFGSVNGHRKNARTKNRARLMHNNNSSISERSCWVLLFFLSIVRLAALVKSYILNQDKF